MVEQFKNHEEVELWLKNQPYDVRCVFVARAALRAVPVFDNLLEGKNQGQKVENIILFPLWSISLALSVGMWPNNLRKLRNVIFASTSKSADVADHADSMVVALAIDAAIAAARMAIDVKASGGINVATNAIVQLDFDALYDNSLYNERMAVYHEYTTDHKFIKSGKLAKDLALQPLWAGTADDNADSFLAGYIKKWERLRSHLRNIDQNWEVWTDWYDDRLKGDEQHKFLHPYVEQVEIGNPQTRKFGRVTLPSKYYENPAKANAIIKQVIEDYLINGEKLELVDIEKIAAATPLAEDIILKDDGKFEVKFLPIRDLHLKNVSRIRGALEKVIKINAFNDSSPEIKFIREIISDHSDDPQRLHDDCGFAQGFITDLIKKEVIADNFDVQRLLDALQQTQMDIRAYEPDVREAFEKRLSLHIDETVELNDSSLKASTQDIQHIQSERLQTEIGEDISTFVGGARGVAGYRLISRFSRMYLQIQNAPLTHSLSDAASLSLMQAAPHIESILQYLRLFFRL